MARAIGGGGLQVRSLSSAFSLFNSLFDFRLWRSEPSRSGSGGQFKLQLTWMLQNRNIRALYFLFWNYGQKRTGGSDAMFRMPSVLKLIVPALLLSCAGLVISACKDASTNNGAGAEIRLQGAGATFPNPLYQKWFSEYNKMHPNAKFDYQSIGSGGGIKQIQSNTVDFAGSDATMTDQQLQESPGQLLHIPSVLGAVVLTYNIPTASNAALKFSPDSIAGIYLGNIKKWNDPKLAAD